MTHKSPKSLMRMLGPHGNPQARNLFEMLPAGARGSAFGGPDSALTGCSAWISD